MSASARLSELVKLDETFTQVLSSFVTAVGNLENSIDTLRQETTAGLQITSDLLSGPAITHPTDQFLVLKRFMDKWAKVKNEITLIEEQLKQINEVGLTLKSNITREESQIPTAYQSVFRLQNIYNIPAQNISQGIIFSHKSEMEFNERDSFYCGKFDFLEKIVSVRHTSFHMTLLHTSLAYQLGHAFKAMPTKSSVL